MELSHPPNCPEADLNKRIDERLKLALPTTVLAFILGVTCSCEHNGPEINTMYELPVIDLLIRFL